METATSAAIDKAGIKAPPPRLMASMEWGIRAIGQDDGPSPKRANSKHDESPAEQNSESYLSTNNVRQDSDGLSEGSKRPSIVNLNPIGIDSTLASENQERAGVMKGKKTTRFLKRFIVGAKKDVFQSVPEISPLQPESRGNSPDPHKESEACFVGLLGDMDKVEWSYGYKYKEKNIGIQYEPFPVFTGKSSV